MKPVGVSLPGGSEEKGEMFDNIGKDLDEQATRRKAESFLYTTLIIGASLGVIVYLTARAAPQIMEAIEDLDMVQVDFGEEIEDTSPPPPPPPPASSSADESEPDEVVEEVAELQEIVEKPIVKAAELKPAGVKGGVEGGVEGGVIGGVVGGTGVGRMVSYRDVKIKVPANLMYPNEAKPLNLGNQQCHVTVSIDPKGVPEDVRVKNCPEVFHAEVKRAMRKARWWPYKTGGSKQRAQFTFLITFRLS